MSDLETVRSKFECLRPLMDERLCRLWAACEARSLGHAGQELVAAATGLDLAAVRKGIEEVGLLAPVKPCDAPDLRPEVVELIRRVVAALPVGPARRRCMADTVATLRLSSCKARRLFGWAQQTLRKALHERRSGITCRDATYLRGRKPLQVKDPGLMRALQQLLENEVVGDPLGETKWVRVTPGRLSERLQEMGHQVSETTVWRLLKQLGYSMKANKRRQVRTKDPERDQQFQYIASQREKFKAAGLPVISVDTKKKEPIGNFRNGGKAWCKEAPQVVEHDFPSGAECKATPFGIYDVARNAGHVLVGVSNNTPEFAVNALAGWWEKEGRVAYPEAKEMLILADGGGGNGSRARAWKLKIQELLCDRFGLEVTVCHYPVGCSKWNPVEHRLFGPISRNWAGQPLQTLSIMLAYIRGTTTTTGLKVTARLDEGVYRKGIKVAKEDMTGLDLRASGRNEDQASTNLRQIRAQAILRNASWSPVCRSNRRRSRPKLCNHAIVRSTNQRCTPRPLPCPVPRFASTGVIPSQRSRRRTGSES
jgi:transposase